MRVLVTRPAADAAPLLRRLTELGHEAVSAPLMEIAPRDGVPAPDLSATQALLFTSANGARAFAALSPERGLPALCVGAATAAAAHQAGFSDVRAADGDVISLAQTAAAALDPAAGALLHIAGEHRAGDLAGDLRGRGFTVAQLVAYEARAVDHLPAAAAEALRAESLDAVLFHSPRTARLFATLVRDAGLVDATARLAAFALSPAAVDAADLPFRLRRAPARPEQEALLALLAETPPVDLTVSTPSASAFSSEPTMSDDAVSPAADPLPAPAPTPAPPRRGGFGAGLFGGLIGAALLLGGAGAAGWSQREHLLTLLAPNAGKAAAEATAALESRVTAAELKLRRLETAPATEALDARLTKLEEQARAAGLPTAAKIGTAAAQAATVVEQAATEAHAQVQSHVQGLGDALGQELQRRLDQLEQALSAKADAGALTAVATANTQLAQSVGGFDDRIAKAEKAAESGAVDQTRRAALAVAVAKLDQAARAGAAYAPLLRAAKALAGDDPHLTPAFDALTPRAEKGLVTTEALRRRFPDLARQAKALDMAEGEQGWRAEVLRFMGELVTVRRTASDPTAQDLDAKLARADARLAAGDLAGAVAALDGLPSQSGAALADWLKDAKARLDGDAALTALAERTLVMLAAPSAH